MRMILFLLTLSAASLGLASGARADCDSANTQMEINTCLDRERERADNRLNETYANAIAAMRGLDAALPVGDRGAEDALRAAQRAWIAFRDSACEAESFLMRGGSGESMVILSCLGRLTEARIADLEILAETR